ncbi:MAG: hypothetical protein M3461_02490 [Pseudomonadota bacterium]|nr:hypothetical protein [Pseudomonadota bacterium]
MTTKRKAAKSSKAAKKPKSAATRSARTALSIGTSARRTVKERVAALAEAPLAVCGSDESLQALLNVLRDQNEPVAVRLAALQSLAAASFSVVAFESCRGDYIATLREVAVDPDPELRQRVLGLLAREKDGFAQKKLLEGLQNPEKALVPPEKALQLLSYDVHAEAYSVARDIVRKPPNDDAKREALRLLAADATAAPVFEKILRDKDESAETRQISASALHALKPEKLRAHAREMLLDTSEYDEIQATSLTALTQFGDDAAVANDEALLKSVDRLSAKASTKVKQSARRFLSKYRR